jgi:hypothetical protein
VIPYIDTLFDALDDQAENMENLPAVRMAAKKGQVMLKKYYTHTDESAIYRIATSMFRFARYQGVTHSIQF